MVLLLLVEVSILLLGLKLILLIYLLCLIKVFSSLFFWFYNFIVLFLLLEVII